MMTNHERLVFTDFRFNHFPDARCRAEVELTRRSGDHVVGTREGKGAEIAALRCAAQATMDAIQKVVDPRRSFELLGVKSVHAFDTVIVIVCVGVTDPEGRVGGDGRIRELIGPQDRSWCRQSVRCVTPAGPHNIASLLDCPNPLRDGFTNRAR